MKDILKESWSAFSNNIASEYLKTYGHPSVESKDILTKLLKSKFKKGFKVVDLGCGNGQLYGYFKEKELDCTYVGVDFSEPLLKIARDEYGTDENVEFRHGDVNDLNLETEYYDVAIYSHVIEILSSPELSLLSIRRNCKNIIVRFFEPPEFEVDTVELKQMNLGKEDVFYLRRKMSKDHYRLILSKIGAKEVEVYKDPFSKDQIHFISF